MKKVFVLAKTWYESITEPFELIKDNFGSLVGYEVLCRVLAFLVLFPIIAWADSARVKVWFEKDGKADNFSWNRTVL